MITQLLNYSFALAGQALSSWSIGPSSFVHNVTAPNLSTSITCFSGDAVGGVV
jgi:hypothetical protein